MQAACEFNSVNSQLSNALAVDTYGIFVNISKNDVCSDFELRHGFDFKFGNTLW